jgi:hypothetical protein
MRYIAPVRQGLGSGGYVCGADMSRTDGVAAQEAVVHFHLFSFSRCFSNSKSPALARSS